MELFFFSASVQTPYAVTVQALSKNSVVVQWEFGDQEVNGFVVKYIHQPTKGYQDNGRWLPTTVANATARHLYVENLNPDTPYAFCVLAVRDNVRWSSSVFCSFSFSYFLFATENSVIC